MLQTSSGCSKRGRAAGREAAALAARRLEIAAVTTAAESFVPGMMRAFAEQHPDIDLELVVGNRQDVLERVSSHSARRGDHGQAAQDRPAGRGAVHEKRDRLHHRARRSGRSRRSRHPGAAVRSTLAPEGAGLWNSSAQRAVPRRARPRAEDAYAGLERGHQAGRPRRARGFAAVQGCCRDRARVRMAGRASSTGGPEARPWFLLRSAIGPVRPAVELFTSYVMAQDRRGRAPRPRRSRLAR